jgi:hypothetical protein
MTFDEFLRAVNGIYMDDLAENADCRYGKSLFTYLCRVNPGLAEAIRGTTLDPSHKEFCPDTVNFLSENWANDAEQ